MRPSHPVADCLARFSAACSRQRVPFALALTGLTVLAGFPAVQAGDRDDIVTVRDVIETAAVGLAVQAELPTANGTPCSRSNLEVRYELPDQPFERGAHLEPLGPPPEEATREVNGVVVCRASFVAYLGFEAWIDDETWQVAPVPDPGEDDHGDHLSAGPDGTGDDGFPTEVPSPPPPAVSGDSTVPGSVAPGQPAGFEGLSVVRSFDSTAYCLGGTMANDRKVHDGAVAMNGVDFGTRWKVLSGPAAGRTYEVADRIGHSSEFDIWMASCGEAVTYGRHPIRAAVAGYARSIEAYAPYEPQRTCDPAPKPGVAAFAAMVLGHYGGTRSLGISRACGAGGRSEHKEGRAFDWGVRVGVPSERAAAEDLIAWLLRADEHGNAHANARRLGVMYVIWNHQIWSAHRASAGWRGYHGASAHTDHVHVSFSWAGARGETSFWGGAPPSPDLLAPGVAPAPVPGLPSEPSIALPPGPGAEPDDDREHEGDHGGGPPNGRGAPPARIEDPVEVEQPKTDDGRGSGRGKPANGDNTSEPAPTPEPPGQGGEDGPPGRKHGGVPPGHARRG